MISAWLPCTSSSAARCSSALDSFISALLIIASAMIGMVTTMTWLTMFQGQPLELEEDQPDEERVNEQQDEFHYDCPPLLLACSSSSATRARSCSISLFSSFASPRCPMGSSTSVP